MFNFNCLLFKKELMISTGPYDQVVGKLARESARPPSFSMA